MTKERLTEGAVTKTSTASEITDRIVKRIEVIEFLQIASQLLIEECKDDLFHT